MNKSRYAKTRLALPEYINLCARADKKGMKISEFIRELIIHDREKSEIMNKLESIELALSEPTLVNFKEQQLLEVLLLVRELAARANAQILVQVSQKLRASFPEGRTEQ